MTMLTKFTIWFLVAYLLTIVGSITSKTANPLTHEPDNDKKDDISLYRVAVDSTVMLECKTEHTEFDDVKWWRNDSAEFVAQINENNKLYEKGTSQDVDVKNQRTSHICDVPQEKGTSQDVNVKNQINSNYTTRLKFTSSKNILIKSCRVNDSAIYYCETTNKEKQKLVGKPIKLFVQVSTRNKKKKTYLTFSRKKGTSQDVDVQKSERPHCLQKIPKVQALNGTTILLPCQVQGNPEPTITWMKDDEILPKTGRYIQDESGITIKGIDIKDSGKYQITLKNYLVFTHVLELEVLTLDGIKPENYQAVTEHNPVVISCGKRPAKPGDTIEWLKEGINVLNLGDDRFELDKNGSLVIKSALRTDNGLYECASKRRTPDGDMTLSVNMFLNVRYAPSINNIKKQVIVYKGHDSVLPCSASGNPGVTFRWFYPGGKKKITKTEKFEIATNGSLIIRNADMHDSGNYTCAPFNKIGDGKYGFSELKVYLPPKFHNDGKEVSTIRVNKEITLDCSAYGIPTPTVNWSRPLGKKIDWKRATMNPAGLLVIKNVTGDDSGTYICDVSSHAGNISRQQKLQVIGKPGTPHIVKVTSDVHSAFVTWIPSFNGGSKQVFEFWSLPAYRSEFEWDLALIADYSQLSNNEHILSFTGPATDKIGRAMAYWCSIRAKNDEGYSDFGEVFKVIRNPGSKGKKVEHIQDYPLKPYDFQVNMTTAGYSLGWKSMLTPGRPQPDGYRVQYKSENSTAGWITINQRTRRRRSVEGSGSGNNGLVLKAEDLPNVKHPLEFQITAYAYDANGKELYGQVVKPDSVVKNGIPLPPTVIGPDGKVDEKKDDGDLVPPVVLGCIFAVFVIVLIISLYCFCRRRKQRRYQASKTEKKMQYSVEHGVEAQIDATDGTMLLSPKFDMDSPRRFHLRNCPALSLGKYNSHNMSNGSVKDDVYVLLEPHDDEKHMCTCNRKFMTLNSREQQKTKREKKKGLYKSTSSPSVLLTSDIDGSSIDPSELLDDEDYDLSDIEKDQIVELNPDSQRFVPLNRKGFKDSYDQFCRDDGSRRRLSSNEKTEVDKNMEVSQKLKDINDASSENSATESDRIATPRDAQKEEMLKDRVLDSNKSSGFGDGSNSTSDNDSIAQEMLDKPTILRPNGPSPYGYSGYISDSGRRDPGYNSDFSTRSSPLDYMHRNKYHPPSHRHNNLNINNNNSAGRLPTGSFNSDDGLPGYDALTNGYQRQSPRPPAPPSYNQAMVDIERLSEKNEITDSEEMFGNLLEMERQMGVTLDDSLDSDLNIKTAMMPPPPRPYSNPRPPPFGADTGYTSDAQYSTTSDRDKSARCKQLLNEFKSNRGGESRTFSEDDLDEEEPINPPTLRSRSVIDDVTEEPRVPPVLRRSNSAGSSSVYKEWLV